MQLALEQSWKEIFARAAEEKARKRREAEMAVFYRDLDREQHEKQELKEKKDKQAHELEEVLATAEQISQFNTRLDDLDTQTVHSLMENGQALDTVNERLRKMLDNATVLPDGRHVFKTEDGRRVFDEHGAEVPHDVIDPQTIEDSHPKWEAFKAGKATEFELEAERRRLLEFQAKIDGARTRVDKGAISAKDLDTLGADLEANAPPAVRPKLGRTGSTTDAEPTALAVEAPRSLKLDDLVRVAVPQPAPQ